MTSSRIRNIVEHTRKFGFLNERAVSRGQQKCSVVEDTKFSPTSEDSLTNFTVAVHDYGPLGSQMRKNLLDLWWKYSVTLQDNIFPLCVADSDLVSTSNVSNRLTLPYRIRAENNYETFAKLLSSDEVGIAQITVLPAIMNVIPGPSFLMRPNYHEFLTVHHFCQSKRGSTLFNDVIKSRLRWWKRFSNRQANFTHHVKESNTDDTLAVVEIIHDCSSGKSLVERISLGMVNQSENTRNVVECCTNMEQALSAYLDDGFEERILDEEKRSLKVLRLHPNIAPIKMIILTKDTSNEEQSDIADRLCKEVKIAGNTCHRLQLREESAVYDFADATGIPFCLKIDDITLKRGIIGLRHRDTTVHEFMHISEVTETLTKVMNL